MKKLGLICMAWILFTGIAATAHALDVEFHGDLNHRFQRTNRADFLTTDSSSDRAEINDGSVDSFFGEIKYRLWMNASTNDGKVKGVVATEIGGLRFGEAGKMTYSGDQIVFELRWAYTDFQLPFIERNARFKVGLQPFTVNHYIWQETVGGVAFNSMIGDNFDYQLAWMRGAEVDKTASNSGPDDERSNEDAFLARLNFNPGGSIKGGVFGLFQTYDADGANFGNGALDSRDYQIKRFGKDKGINLYSLGIDGGYTGGPFFVNWDLIYQTGEIEDTDFTDFASGLGRSGDFDVSAYFVHFDLGTNFDKFKVQYTFWYASGDDDLGDSDVDAWLAFPGASYYWSEIMGYGMFDTQVSNGSPADKISNIYAANLGATIKPMDKLKVTMDVWYAALAEDNAAGDDVLGTEVDLKVTYQLVEGLNLDVVGAYLFADDATGDDDPIEVGSRLSISF